MWHYNKCSTFTFTFTFNREGLKTEKSPSGVQGQSPGRGLGAKLPRSMRSLQLDKRIFQAVENADEIIYKYLPAGYTAAAEALKKWDGGRSPRGEESGEGVYPLTPPQFWRSAGISPGTFL